MAGCAGPQKSQMTDTLNFITIEEELRLGEELHSFTIKHLEIIRNSQLNSFLNDMAHKISEVSHWPGLDYAVFVINEKDINHLSLPGGTIYIFRGLIEEADSPDEIAAVIAHEIVHIAHRDAVARLAQKYSYSFAAQQVIGDNPEIADHVIMSLYRTNGTILDYPEEQEEDADITSLNYLVDAGYDPRAAATLLEKMRRLEKAQPHRFDLLRMTHASSASRLRRVEKSIKKLQFNPTQFEQKTNEFYQLKDILKKIPQ
jgi:predicted Zn-dependent protease